MESDGDWRSQLLPEARQRIVNKIGDTLKRHLPVSAAEGLNELRKIAIRFEEKVYAAATNQSDYLRKISLKMLSMETKAQTTTAFNPSHFNPPVGNQSPVESVDVLQLAGARSVETDGTGFVGAAEVESGQAVTQNVKNQNIRKEAKEPRKRKSKKQKVDLPSPSETNQSIASLLEQLIQAIAGQQQGQSSMHEQPSSLQHLSTPTPQPQILPLKQQQWTSPKVQDTKAELQSQLESSQNVIENLSKCIPLLQNQLELERSSQVKIRSALDEIKIQEASAKAQQNVSDAILHRELNNLAKAIGAIKERGS